MEGILAYPQRPACRSFAGCCKLQSPTPLSSRHADWVGRLSWELPPLGTRQVTGGLTFLFLVWFWIESLRGGTGDPGWFITSCHAFFWDFWQLCFLQHAGKG